MLTIFKNSRVGFVDIIASVIIAAVIVLAAAFIAGGYSLRFRRSGTPAERRVFPFLLKAPTSTQQTPTTTAP